MVVLIGGEKGGTGKTTLATNLAALRSNEGRDVLLVDTDKQGSASDWAAVREEVDGAPQIPCVQVFGKQVTSQIQDLDPRYDDLVVDAGGRDSVELRSAMVVADRFYVPLQASQFDVWTIERMEELVEQAQAINPPLQARVFINRASPHPQVHEAEEAEEILDEFEHLIFSGVVLHDRIAFRRAASGGVAVTEADSPDPKACSEVQALYDVIFEQTDKAHAQEA
jgi:chromosome partitioning protein